MRDERFKFSTDTATLCVFDLACLKHRMTDDADWWTTHADELIEVNQGNVLFIGLGDDGAYFVSIGSEIGATEVTANLRVPSGRLFIGAGEEATSDGLEPEAIRGGGFLELSPGNYVVSIKKQERTVYLQLSKGGDGRNDFRSPMQLLRKAW